MLRVCLVLLALSAIAVQHTFDENMRVGHYVDGIRTIVGMLRSPY